MNKFTAPSKSTAANPTITDMKKSAKYFLIALPIILAILLVTLETMSRSAAAIFNKAMQEQTLLNGTITVEKLTANLWGEVTFNNLLWKDPRGGTILEIPEGGFTVRLYDILTKNFKSTTIQKLYLKNANISVNLDENMSVDFIRHSPDFLKVSQDMQHDSGDWAEKVSRVNKTEDELKEIGERRRRLQRSKFETGWKNFNLAGRKIHLNLQLEHCQIEVFYRERHYLFRILQCDTHINTADEMTFKIHTGTFGGTMIGSGMDMRGKIDFKAEPVPQCDLTLALNDVDPSSLGFGLNIHDEMTLRARFIGAVNQPVGKGTVQLDELHIPGIDFENVEGEIHYEDAALNFKNVTAEVYGGKLAAYGDYNIDTRYYNIYGHGEKLKTYAALPNSHLHCSVDLDLSINSKGNARETVTGGEFISGKGRYSFLFFDSLSGKFDTEYQNINFYDVEINLSGYKIATDALSIVDGKLTLSPIKITDENGELVGTYVRDWWRGKRE